MPLDHSHNPGLKCWVQGADEHPEFPVQNLPLGIFSTLDDPSPRIGTRIGDHVLDLRALAAAGRLPFYQDCLAADTLNPLFARPSKDRTSLRHALSKLLTDAEQERALQAYLQSANIVAMHLPARIGDYTDFYAGIHHAVTIGSLLRPDNPLLPNYKHIPIGYHGRASSVAVSGQPVIWPQGQRKAPDEEQPSLGPSRRLDYELELGIWVGPGNAMGTAIAIDDAAAHIAGYCLLNDWSARDLQAWEYQPLGPFLAKNFHTSISPWVITSDALVPFRIPQPPRPGGDPKPLPYLWSEADQAAGALSLSLEVLIETAAMREAGRPPHRLSIGPASNLYWTPAQMLAHHSVNGCPMAPGDLLGTGTISTPTAEGQGSLMEISRGGKSPMMLPGGETRTFLEPGDTIIMRATAAAAGARSIGFGECSGTVIA
jgi:fumarylacetoacetase